MCVCWLTGSFVFNVGASQDHGYLDGERQCPSICWNIPDRISNALSLPWPWQWMGNEIQQYSEQVHRLGNQQCTPSVEFSSCTGSRKAPRCHWFRISHRTFLCSLLPVISANPNCRECDLNSKQMQLSRNLEFQIKPIMFKVCAVFQETDGPFDSCPEESGENNVRRDQRHWGFLVLKIEAQDISIAFKMFKKLFQIRKESSTGTGDGTRSPGLGGWFRLDVRKPLTLGIMKCQDKLCGEEVKSSFLEASTKRLNTYLSRKETILPHGK